MLPRLITLTMIMVQITKEVTQLCMTYHNYISQYGYTKMFGECSIFKIIAELMYHSVAKLCVVSYDSCNH